MSNPTIQTVPAIVPDEVPATPSDSRPGILQRGLQFLWRRDWRGFVLPLLALALWWGVTHFKLANTEVLAPPGAVLIEGLHQVFNGGFVWDLTASISRDLAGFTIGGLAGFALGTLLGTSRLAELLVAPSFNAVKQIALFAWIPMISVWFGMGEPAKVVFISLAAFYPVAINTFEGIRSVNRDYAEVARVYGFSRLQLWRRVILPAASPQIFTGLHLALIYAWLATIGAEYFLKSGYGVGNSMIDGREHFNMGSVLFGLVVVGSIGALLNQLAVRLEHRALKWRNRSA
ncbi:ABC transporter permease [Jeongeupia naejangsanensis]|uniref:ABC transporter permease n=1 Tax=Jeongeupia naejangsanensis TaxID=613195 RepID=A0ABS2BN55_9NEIS|nr:ABC transporter permease [Jeongeupia naejangsanensis]MBM3117018.1 ABC transporter permease [Jeongeupia naejangsanensis]